MRAAEWPTPEASVQAMGVGVNFGNCLEAPNEGEWGVRIEADDCAKIKAAGFTSVRVPVKWSNHAAKTAPFAIEPKFLARVDEVLAQAEKAGLIVILNIHHYDEMDKAPTEHRERFLALWTQIAEHYQNAPPTVVFELLNEPHDKLTPELWNEIVPEALKIVRAKHPQRNVVIGPGSWNNVNFLSKLALPADDRHIIGTFHYYEPFQFTHQGAHWVNGSDKWKGKTWTGTSEELDRLRKDFDKAADWSKSEKRPLLLGEFGAFNAAPQESRATWTKAVVEEAAKRGFAATYWEYSSGFGVYDPANKVWRDDLRKALIGK
ncbi:MAG: glycoside hydrolase family 5 protein [Pirellulales bacterium]